MNRKKISPIYSFNYRTELRKISVAVVVVVVCCVIFMLNSLVISPIGTYSTCTEKIDRKTLNFVGFI